jgi:hypothetical protein
MTPDEVRAFLRVDEDVAPYAFVHIRGEVTLSEDPKELMRFATAIGGRYMGADRAQDWPPKCSDGRAARAAPTRARDCRGGRRRLIKFGVPRTGRLIT